MQMLEAYSEESFTDKVKKAWKIFFEYTWEVIEGSQERIRIKEMEDDNIICTCL